jgi:hypothetical protein
MTGTRLEFDKVYHEANRMVHMTVMFVMMTTSPRS